MMVISVKVADCSQFLEQDGSVQIVKTVVYALYVIMEISTIYVTSFIELMGLGEEGKEL